LKCIEQGKKQTRDTGNQGQDLHTLSLFLVRLEEQE
jgi:hypothetical protein